jgi:hypothetical protein
VKSIVFPKTISFSKNELTWIILLSMLEVTVKARQNKIKYFGMFWRMKNREKRFEYLQSLRKVKNAR